MSDSDSDADCDNFIKNYEYTGRSLLCTDTTGYAFLRIKVHLRP